MRKSSVTGGRTSLIPLRIKSESLNTSKASLEKPSLSFLHYGTSKKSTPHQSLKTIIPSSKRTSSNYGRLSHHEVIKDPRPINDKAFQQKCIKNLLEFVMAHGYPHPINPKLLAAPSTKDFIHIFEFINRFLVANFRVKKIEDDVPRMFKLLKYPFNNIKSSISSVISPHAWPALLAALTWLIGLVEYAFDIKMDKILFPKSENDFDHIVTEYQLLFDFSVETYKEFMAGADTFDSWEEQLSFQLVKLFLGNDGGIKELQAQNQALTNELQMLEALPCQQTNLKELKTKSTEDEKAFNEYLNELDGYILNVETSLKDNEEIMKLDSDCEYLRDKNKKNEEILISQEFSSEDAELFHKEKQELQKCINSIEEEVIEINKQIWKEEMNFCKNKEQFETKCKTYNNFAMKMNLIPSSAKNAYGQDLELKPLFNVDHVAQRSTIMVFLTNFKKQLVDSRHKLETSLYSEKENLDQILEINAEKEEEIKNLEKNVQRLADEIEIKKMNNQSEVAKHEEEANFLCDQIQDLRKPNSQILEILEKELRDLKLEENVMIKKLETERDNWINFLWKLVKKVVEHKCKLNNSIDQLHYGVKQQKDILFSLSYKSSEQFE